MSEVTWNVIETEYVSGDLSYRELAKKHQVSIDTIRNRGKTRGWPALRKQYKEDELIQTYSKMATKMSDKRLEALQEDLEVSQQVINRIKQMLTNEEGIYEVKDIKALADSLQVVVGTRFKLLGLLTPGEYNKLEIEREKLLIEKKKQEKEQIQDNTVKILLSPELEKWGI